MPVIKIHLPLFHEWRQGVPGIDGLLLRLEGETLLIDVPEHDREKEDKITAVLRAAGMTWTTEK